MKCIYELILGNYARCTYLLQSPRSGKFVSDLFTAVTLTKRDKCFNPLDRGNLYQIRSTLFGVLRNEFGLFQSPRSGEFVSNAIMKKIISFTLRIAFQSPRSGKFVSDVPKRCLQQSKRYNV